jgi:hypothetical protein
MSRLPPELMRIIIGFCDIDTRIAFYRLGFGFAIRKIVYEYYFQNDEPVA